jgi:hypothetical protein
MDLLTTSAAARLPNLTTDCVMYHEREGHLLAIRVERGSGEFMRLFVREDIERFARQRASRQQEKTAQTTNPPDREA